MLTEIFSNQLLQEKKSRKWIYGRKNIYKSKKYNEPFVGIEARLPSLSHLVFFPNFRFILPSFLSYAQDSLLVNASLIN